jgi:hypothetical protein
VNGKVLAIGLDGYEPSLEDELVAAGSLPGIARFRRESARFRLDPGSSQRTGLSWEHFSSGLSPRAAGRYAAVTFDPSSYSAWQEGVRCLPFASAIGAPTAVFDAPYFDLGRAPDVRGVVGWGAHDPGVAPSARPAELWSEFSARFGRYPAAEWIYGFAWPSAERCRAMGRALADAVSLRSRAAQWLLRERLRDWSLAIVVVSEPHSAIEGLWHGVDPSHPLHRLPSAAPAGEGLRSVYHATDRLVADLAGAFADATAIVFSMGGMGPNRSDAASMFLLPELLYRHAFGRPLMRQPDHWTRAPDGIPLLPERANWSDQMNALIPEPESAPEPGGLRRAVARVAPEPLKCLARRILRGGAGDPAQLPPMTLGWMPAIRYRPHWPEMRAFALPSFYDGRVRINLAGREREGRVAVAEYSQVCDEIEALVRACRDPATGEGVVESVERPADGRDPRRLDGTDADLVFVWNGPLAFDHPSLGRVGPIPFRRTGGHTRPHGMAYLRGPRIAPGDRGVRSSFDVAPTVVDLLGEAMPPGTSGTSLLAG